MKDFTKCYDDELRVGVVVEVGEVVVAEVDVVHLVLQVVFAHLLVVVVVAEVDHHFVAAEMNARRSDVETHGRLEWREGGEPTLSFSRSDLVRMGKRVSFFRSL